MFKHTFFLAATFVIAVFSFALGLFNLSEAREEKEIIVREIKTVVSPSVQPSATPSATIAPIIKKFVPVTKTVVPTISQ